MSASIRAGDQWMERLREGLRACEQAVGLLSYGAHERPWIPAEWAAFWMLGKLYTPVLIGIELSQIWEPMRSSQAVTARDSAEVEGLLSRLAGRSESSFDADIVNAAREIAGHPAVTVGMADQALARVLAHLPTGTDNVDRRDVHILIEEGRLGDLIREVTSVPAASVKLRQVADELAVSGRLSESLEVIRYCENLNERLNAVRQFVAQLQLPPASDAVDFLRDVAALLRPPQLRTLRLDLERVGLDPALIVPDA